MRPHGEIRKALLAAAQREPGSVTEICIRAQVGLSAGRYTASRMVGSGDLVVLSAGRPALLGAAVPAQEKAHPVCGDAFDRLCGLLGRS